MIVGLIFFVHFIFILAIFVKKWQDESLSAGITNSFLIIILFAIGWSLTTFIAKVIFEPKGFGIYFDRDTISLTVLSVFEYFFYKMYFKNDFISDDKGK